jgi:hypothetical protein
MLQALLAGERDAQKLASMALGRLRRKLPELELALTGQFTEHHGRLIALSLELIDLLERQIAELDEQIRLLVEPLLPQLEQLDSIPGVDATAARDILGEIGTDMSRFGSAARKTSTFLGRTFRRLEARLGGKRAAVAVGHKMLVIVYHLLWQGTYYEEQRYADQQPNQEERDYRRAITALKRLGYDVTVKRVA